MNIPRRICAGCDQAYQPQGSAQRYCQPSCRPQRRRCELCERVFRPKRVKRRLTRYCSRDCVCRAADMRRRGKAPADPGYRKFKRRSHKNRMTAVALVRKARDHLELAEQLAKIQGDEELAARIKRAWSELGL